MFSCGFFNSKNHDRRYNAVQFGSIFDGVINDGVYETYGDKFRVRINGANSIIVASGRAWFDHTWNLNDSDMTLTLPPPDKTRSRWDVVILETNHEDPVRNNDIKVISGGYGNPPELPTLIRGNLINQYPIAYIYREANTNTPKETDLRNVVGTSDCPYAKITPSMVPETEDSGEAPTISQIPAQDINSIFTSDILPAPTNLYLDQQGLGIFAHDLDTRYATAATVDAALKAMEPTVLYFNTAGSTGTISLSQSIGNFKYLEYWVCFDDWDNSWGGHYNLYTNSFHIERRTIGTQGLTGNSTTPFSGLQYSEFDGSSYADTNEGGQLVFRYGWYRAEGSTAHSLDCGRMNVEDVRALSGAPAYNNIWPIGFSYVGGYKPYLRCVKILGYK